MNTFIESLKKYSILNFPVNEVSTFIMESDIQKYNLAKYEHFSKKMYTRNRIYKDEHFEILLLCWLPNQMAPIHGHEGEKCWFKVLNGSLEICNYSLQSTNPLSLILNERINASIGYVDGPADIHSIKNCSQDPVSTLHIYTKPYDTCAVYDLKKKSIDRLKMLYHSIDGKLC